MALSGHLRVLARACGRIVRPALLALLCPWRVAASEPSRIADRLLLGNTIDANSLRGLSTDVTLTVSPFGSYSETGPRIRLTGAIGQYRYWGNRERTFLSTGTDYAVELLLGYGFAGQKGFLTLAAGPIEIQSTQTPGDGGRSTRSTLRGGKIFASYFGIPAKGMMVFLQSHYSTISDAYYVQTKIGRTIAPWLFLGPEVTISGGTGYGQWRAGLHLTGIRLGPAQLGLSAGFLDDRSRGLGGYTGTTLFVNF